MTDQPDRHDPGGEAEALIEALLGFHAALEASTESELPALTEFLR